MWSPSRQTSSSTQTSRMNTPVLYLVKFINALKDQLTIGNAMEVTRTGEMLQEVFVKSTGIKLSAQL